MKSDLIVFNAREHSPVLQNLRLNDHSSLGKLPLVFGLLWRAIRHYDVLHFNYGRSILFPFDLQNRRSLSGWRSRLFLSDMRLLRTLGKRIVVTFQGCDARQRDVTATTNAHSACAIPSCSYGLCTAEYDEFRRQAIARVREAAHQCFCLNPDLLRFVEGSTFLPYASVDPREVKPKEPQTIGPLRVVHAPSDRIIKGSNEIVSVLRDLQRRFPLHLDLVEGVPRAEAWRRYRLADLAIDQLNVGWYGSFAVEMMALGVPVICFIRDADAALAPADLVRELPIVRVYPGRLREVMLQILRNRARLRALGQASRRFVERWHDPLRLAIQMRQIYASCRVLAEAPEWGSVLAESDNVG